MISLSLVPFSASSLSFKPALGSNFKSNHKPYHHKKKSNLRRFRNVICRAEFSHDGPFAVAIAACIFNSLVFPITSGPDDGEGDSVIDSTDARFAVMGIISFIPYFNWLSWVIAWLDTGERRYAVYTIVYLAPYLRANLSLSPEESWLPIASILFCIFHIQLEASIKNGDIQGFRLFSGAQKDLASIGEKKDAQHGHKTISKEGREKDDMSLPSAEEQSKSEIQGWGVPQKPLQDYERLNEDGDTSEGRRH